MHTVTAPPIDLKKAAIVRVAVGLVLFAASCALGAWTLWRGDAPFTIDIWWNSLFGPTNTFLIQFSLVMNFLGGGWFGVFVVPIVAAILLLIAKRPWAALYFILASAVSAGLVQILKHLFSRVRPDEMLVISDHGSYPSGHVANAATIATVLFIIFPRLWVLLAGIIWTFLMALSRTIVHAHWLTDTIGGALAGVGAALLVAAALTVVLFREQQRRGSLG